MSSNLKFYQNFGVRLQGEKTRKDSKRREKTRKTPEKTPEKTRKDNFIL